MITWMASEAKIFAQAAPTATRFTNFQVGIGVSAANPDYSDNTLIKGVSVYGSVDFGRHLGIDGEIHDLKLSTPRDFGESSYLLGLRYGITYGRFHPYAKALAGLGNFSLEKGTYSANSSSTHRMLSFGAGLDYHATDRMNVRVFDLELQRWPGFPPNGLTPVVGTMGAAYTF